MFPFPFQKDLQFGVEQGVDVVFASFIRKARDVEDIKKELGEKGKHIWIISKVGEREGGGGREGGRRRGREGEGRREGDKEGGREGGGREGTRVRERKRGRENCQREKEV